MSVWHDVGGQGPAVVLLHAGLADSRMWEPQLAAFGESHTVVRVDFPGFGQSPIEAGPVSLSGSVREAMDAAGIERAAIVGVSLGGRAAVELAAESPERVSALVLVGPGIDDHEWSAEVESFGAAEEEALARGDLEAAIETNLQMWLAGPRRTLEAIEPDVRALVAEMQRDAFRAQQDEPDFRLQRREEFNRLVLGFLAEHGV